MTDMMDWNGLSQDWQAVEVDTSACMSIVNSVRRRSYMMLSGVILEILGLVFVVTVLAVIYRIVPLPSPLIVWALFGLVMSVVAVAFKLRNSMGLWRSQAETTSEMLKLSHHRLEAIDRSARFNRRLTVVFAVVLPAWSAVVLWLNPDMLLARGWVTLSVFAFAVVWLGAFWIVTGKALARCRTQLKAVAELLSEFTAP